MSYPRKTPERYDLREELANEYIKRAQIEATMLGRTLVCRTGPHLKCVKTAASCLCPCHDPEED